MAKDDRPTLHILAGPNGAGKSTLYRNRIGPQNPSAELVNADELARQHYGRPAQTAEESQTGQRLAEERRRELMANRQSLVTESTFSHPSKVDLVREAKDSGYRVALYHVHVRSPRLAVERVGYRARGGGHPVPEDRIRSRYERNQSLIRDAAQLADRTHVYDNSALNQPPKRALELAHGEPVWVGQNVPKWVRELYAQALANYPPKRQNRPAASFAAARSLTTETLGKDAQTYIARSGSTYKGVVIGQTATHVVQQIGKRASIAHFTSRLDRVPGIGEHIQVGYDERGYATTAKERGPHASVADAWRADSAQAARDYPDYAVQIAKSDEITEAAREFMAARGAQPAEQDAVAERVADRVANAIEQGERLPEPPDKERVHERGRNDGTER